MDRNTIDILTHCTKCDVYAPEGQCNCHDGKQSKPKITASKATVTEEKPKSADVKPTGDLLSNFLNG